VQSWNDLQCYVALEIVCIILIIVLQCKQFCLFLHIFVAWFVVYLCVCFRHICPLCLNHSTELDAIRQVDL